MRSWLVSSSSSPESWKRGLEFMSRVRLLREPEDRKARIGGTRTAVDGDESVLLLVESGGR